MLLGGLVVAESEAPLLLEETFAPLRTYFAPSEVRMELLTPSPKRTTCPYKGEATYWSAVVGDEHLHDIAWTYATPKPAVSEIAGHLAFWDERVELVRR